MTIKGGHRQSDKSDTDASEVIMGEYRSTKGENPPETVSEKKHRLIRNTVISVAVFAAVYFAGALIKVPRRIPASGFATTRPYAEVRSPVNGTVAEIAAASGDDVAEGAVLARLADEIQRAALQRAEIEADRILGEIDVREARYAEELRSHSNAVATASLSLDFAVKKLAITKQLAEKGLASSRDLMADEYQVSLAGMQYEQIRGKDTDVGRKELEALRRQLDAARAAVRSAKADLEARVIRAPVSGKVLRHTFFVGEVARADQVLFEVFGSEEKLLRLRVAERYATRISRGMRVRVEFRPEKPFFGHRWVETEIGEMRDAIQIEGNDPFRVIYCSYDPSDSSVPPGTTADAEITTGDVSLWSLIFNN